MKFRDYYEILGVPRNADAETIKKVYRKLARKYHPDVNKGSDAEAKFKEIAEAYDVLGDAVKRKKYDSLGADWKNGQEFRPPPGGGFRRSSAGGPGGAGGFSDFFGKSSSSGGRGFSSEFGGGDAFSDFFESLFGNSDFGHPRSSSQRRAAHPSWTESEKGQDVEAEIEISLEDAYYGVAKSISLKISETDEGGRSLPKIKKVDFKVPPGTTDGTKIRLKGMGSDSYNGGPNGDLYLKIHFAKHPKFTVNGHDLETTLLLTPWDASLGANVAVATIEGDATIKIKPGTQSGQVIRLKGKGLPFKGKDDRGDLYAKVMIMVPVNLTAEEKELFKKLSQVSTFKPA